MTTEQKQDLAKRKEFARILYIQSKLNQKAIAIEADVSEQTIVTWAKEGKWAELKTSLSVTDTEQIAALQKMLQALIEEGNRLLEDDDLTTNPDADRIIKISKALSYLKNKTGAAQMYETGTAFISFLHRENQPLAKQIAPLFHAFIKENL